MARSKKAELVDTDNPEWDDATFAKAKSFDDSSLPESFKAAVKRSPGRPKADITKDSVTIRLSTEVTEYFRSTGRGWQTRLDEVLKEYVRSHK